MSVNYDIVYYQNVNYNSTQVPLDSYYLANFPNELLDKQINYNVAVNKFKISDLSTIPLGFNLPFEAWECAIKYNNKFVRLPVPQVDASTKTYNFLYNLVNNNIQVYLYNFQNQLTAERTIALSNEPTGCIFCVVDLNGIFYVSTSTELYAYDPEGNLLASKSFTNIVYLSMSKLNQAIVCDKGTETVYFLVYENNGFTEPYTISKNFAGSSFVNLSSCSYDNTSGLITYDGDSYTLIDSGFNVIKDNLKNTELANVTGSEIITNAGFGYMIDNAFINQGSVDTPFIVDINTNGNIQIKKSTDLSTVADFTPIAGGDQVYPINAVYDARRGYIWANDYSQIYIFGLDGTFVSAKANAGNIIHSSLDRSSNFLTCVNNAGTCSVLFWSLDSTNTIIEATGAIRNNKASTPITNISCACSNSSIIAVAYNSNYITTYNALTLDAIFDYSPSATGALNITDITIDPVTNNIYYVDTQIIPSIVVAEGGYNNFYNLNKTGSPNFLMWTGTAGSTSSLAENITNSQYDGNYVFNANPNSEETTFANNLFNTLTPSSTFGSYATGPYPAFICQYNVEGNICFIGYAVANITSQISILTIGSTNQFTNVYNVPTGTLSGALKSMSVDNLGYIWLNDNGGNLWRSSLSPNFTGSAPYLDFTGVTFQQVPLFIDLAPTTCDSLCWSNATNECYLVKNGTSSIYKGYYNYNAESVYAQFYRNDHAYSSFIILGQEPYGTGEVNLNALSDDWTITLQNNVKSFGLGICNQGVYVGQVLSAQQQITIFAKSNGQQVSFVPVTNNNFQSFTIPSVNSLSNIVSISLTTSNIVQSYQIGQSVNGICRNANSSLILVSSNSAGNVVAYDETSLYPKYTYTLTNPNTIFSNNGLMNVLPQLPIYDYNDYINQVNTCLSNCFTQLSANDPTITVSAPSFSLNKVTGLLLLTYDPSFDLVTSGIYLNNTLSQYFKFSSVDPKTVGLEDMLKIVLNPTGSLSQQFFSLYQLNQLDKIVLQTSLNIYSDVTANATQTLNIFTEFDIDTSNTQGLMYNEGSLLYSAVLLRNYNMTSTNALRHMQYSMYYQFKDGSKYKFYISPNNNISLKLQFTRVF